MESYIARISKYEIKTMSFAVIQTGGKQYKVSTSEILKIERLNNQEGKTVEFKNVLFLNDDKSTDQYLLICIQCKVWLILMFEE